MHVLASKQRYSSARLLHWRWWAISLQSRDDKLANASYRVNRSSGRIDDLKGGVVRNDRKKPVPSNDINGPRSAFKLPYSIPPESVVFRSVQYREYPWKTGRIGENGRHKSSAVQMDLIDT